MLWLLKKLGFDTVAGAETWKSWWSTWLTVVTTVAASVIAAYLTLPEDWKQYIPEWVPQWTAWVTVGTAALNPLVSLILQPKLAAKAKDQAPTPGS